MSISDYSDLGALGERISLDPCIDALLVRPAEPVYVKTGLLHRPKIDETAPTEVAIPIVIFEFSVAAIGFAIPEGETLHPHDLWTVRGLDSETEVQVIGTHEVEGLEAWGAMFVDTRPALLQAIEESVLHLDVASEEEHWNAGRD